MWKRGLRATQAMEVDVFNCARSVLKIAHLINLLTSSFPKLKYAPVVICASKRKDGARNASTLTGKLESKHAKKFTKTAPRNTRADLQSTQAHLAMLMFTLLRTVRIRDASEDNKLKVICAC
jgi:hypothetical protein